MSTNATGRHVVHVPIHEAFRHFDRLPRRLRDALNDAAVPFDPAGTAEAFDFIAFRQGAAAAEIALLAALRRSEEQELQRFGLAFLAEHGDELPHLAAQATTMRAIAR